MKTAHPSPWASFAKLLIFGHFLFAFSLAFGFQWPGAKSAAADTVAVVNLPPEARETLDLIKRGGPFPYRRDGIAFQNRERRLPAQPRGYYSEYTVTTPGSRDRGARRIIAGAGPNDDPRTSGEYYYTDDHYRSFRRIRE